MPAATVSAERLMAIIPFPVLTPIIGEPNNESLQVMTDELCANASSVDCVLGDGTTGYLFLVLAPATMTTLSATTCVPPPKPPSECPVGDDKTTAKQLEALRHGWEEAHAAFVEYRTISGILRRQLLAAVGAIYVDQLRAPYTQFSAVTVLALLQHLVDCYTKIGAR